jgi:hypothetical protein
MGHKLTLQHNTNTNTLKSSKEFHADKEDYYTKRAIEDGKQ